MTMDRRQFLSLATAQLASEMHGRLWPSRADGTAERSVLVEDRVDLGKFLARHDLIWDRMPKKWGEAPFFGNGHFALSMQAENESGIIRFSVDHTDVYDRRDASWGTVSYSRSRYHVGDFLLKLQGQVVKTNLRLRLEQACLEGSIATTAGVLELRAYVHAMRDFAVVEMNLKEGEESPSWTWRPGEPSSSRPPIRTEEEERSYEALYGHPAKLWVPNPQGTERVEEDMQVYVQELLAGGGYSTAWKIEPTTGRGQRLVVSTAMSWPELTSPGRAVEVVRRATSARAQEDEADHARWWRQYYEKSFLTLPDGELEGFYWIQMYKYGCAAPKDMGIIDTHGPWLQPTSWPYITWNLNSQISYWGLQPSNRLELAESLFRALDHYRETLHTNVRPVKFQRDSAVLGHCSQQDLIAPLDGDVRYELEWGNLLWICHNYWLQFRFTMDDQLLDGRLFPLLRDAVAFYLHSILRGEDGWLHLPPTYSPETSTTRDCNYDLALLRWGAETLLVISSRLGVDDPDAAQWREISKKLVPYPTDEHGYRVGADLTAQAHRHFSHLLMIYPLHLVTWDDLGARALIRTSVDYWLSASASEKAQTGFTLAVGASMRATMGDGDGGLRLLEQLLDSGDGRHKIMPNTMYAESGQNIESPLAASQAIHDMVLQSWGGVLRIFPAIPVAWKQLTFRDLRAEGAFLVSSRREGGRTRWVWIRSLAGERCVVDCDLPALAECRTERGRRLIRKSEDGRFEIPLQKGEEVLLQPVGNRKTAKVEACRLPAEETNFFGVHGERDGKNRSS